MRILESAPRRYELGIRLLTLGRLDKAYDRLASHIERGQQVLDIGCGTGALTLRAAKRAGLYCVAVPNPLTKQLHLDGADLVLDSLADLPLQELIASVEDGGGD
jgi:ubiquinone/menaquinone biosynthesis C-methylase UbiE